MFKNLKFEIERINSIPIDYGILYELLITKEKEPYIKSKKFNDKDGKIAVFENVLLKAFAVNERMFVKKSTIDILNSIDKKLEYNMELPPSLANSFMEQVEKQGIKIGESFYLKKIKTDNEYKPLLEIKKK